MMKGKGIALVLLALVTLGAALGAEDFRPPVEIKEFVLEAQVANGVVNLRWKEYLRPDMKWYKVVRSRTNPQPVYPDDESIFVGDRSNQTSHVDRNVSPGTWYYRVTIVTQNNERWVSPVVTVVVPAANVNPPTGRDFR